MTWMQTMLRRVLGAGDSGGRTTTGRRGGRPPQPARTRPQSTQAQGTRTQGTRAQGSRPTTAAPRSPGGAPRQGGTDRDRLIAEAMRIHRSKRVVLEELGEEDQILLKVLAHHILVEQSGRGGASSGRDSASTSDNAKQTQSKRRARGHSGP